MIVRVVCETSACAPLEALGLRPVGEDRDKRVLLRGVPDSKALQTSGVRFDEVALFASEADEAASVVWSLAEGGHGGEEGLLELAAAGGVSPEAARAALDGFVAGGWLARVSLEGGVHALRLTTAGEVARARIRAGDEVPPPFVAIERAEKAGLPAEKAGLPAEKAGLPADEAGRPAEESGPPAGPLSADEALLRDLLADGGLRLSTKEAALFLGVEERTLRNYKKRGGFPQELARGRAKTYGLGELVEFARAHGLALEPKRVPALCSALEALRARLAAEQHEGPVRYGLDALEPGLSIRGRP